MIPILYGTTETAFTTQGKGRLAECTSCIVTEELNGIYELEFQYPISGNLYNEMVTNGGIVYATHDDTKAKQAFEIYKYSAPINGLVTFYAHHISYRLNKIVVKPFTATSCADAVSKIVTNSMQTNPFTFSTDKTVATAFATTVPMSARSLLGGVEGSLLDQYGGDLKFDNFTVSLLVNRGTATTALVKYGRNMTDLTKDHDESDIYNAVVPFWKGGDDTVVWYNGTVVAAGQTAKNVTPLDLSSDFSDPPTSNDLATRAAQYLADNTPWIPNENITVKFLPMWQDPEYAKFASFDNVSLGDTLTVEYTALKVSGTARVVKTVYNVLADRYDSIEVGKLKTTLADALLNSVNANAKNVNERMKAYVPSSGGTFTGDVSFEGLADEIDRRCTATIPASSVGWKRILTYSAISANMAIGSNPFTVDITLFEQARQIHSIRLNGTYTNIFFDNEQSVTQNSSYNAFDGIRYTYDGNNQGHIDVHYALSSSRSVTAFFDVKCRGLDYRVDFAPVDFTAVADAPTGETIYATYSFVDNGTKYESLLANTFNGIGIETGTIASGNSKSFTIPNSGKAVFFINGDSVTVKCVILANASAGGTISTVKMPNEATNITITTASNTVTITSNSYTAYVLKLSY